MATYLRNDEIDDFIILPREPPPIGSRLAALCDGTGRVKWKEREDGPWEVIDEDEWRIGVYGDEELGILPLLQRPPREVDSSDCHVPYYSIDGNEECRRLRSSRPPQVWVAPSAEPDTEDPERWEIEE